MTEYKLDGYVDVAERIRRFYETYPKGRLGPLDPAEPYEIVSIGGDLLVVYKAAAWRSPEDTLPGVGVATERYPGLTPYTRGSEVMNAETSAWGRAIVAVGILSRDEGIASAQEVANRRDEAADVVPARNAKAGLLDLVSGDKKTAAAIWADAGLVGAEHLTQAQYDDLLDLARPHLRPATVHHLRRSVDPFPVDDDDDEPPPPPAPATPPPLPPDLTAAVDELKTAAPVDESVEDRSARIAQSRAPDALEVDDELGEPATTTVAQAEGARMLRSALDAPAVHAPTVAAELVPLLALDATPADALPTIVAAIEELLPRLDKMRLRDYAATGLWDAASGGASLPTTKVTASDVIRRYLAAELEKCHDLAAVAAEFS